MNPLVVPVTSVKLMNNLRELVCIRSDRKFLNELKFYKEDIYIKFRETSGRNFVTESCVNSRLMTHAQMQR